MSRFNYDGKCTCGAQSIFDCRCDLSNKCRSAIAQNGEDAWPRKTQKMDLNEFSKINIQRSTSPDGFNHPMDKWSIAEWTNAMCGEAGEAAIIAKKMIRKRDGVGGPALYRSDAALREALLKELADTVTYADLCAQAIGGSLSEALREKFDEVSIRLGFPHRMPAVQPPSPSWGMVKLEHQTTQLNAQVAALLAENTRINNAFEAATVASNMANRKAEQLNSQLEKQAEHHAGDMTRLEEQIGAIGKALGLSPEASHDTMIVLAKKRAGSRSRHAQLERENRTLKSKLTDVGQAIGFDPDGEDFTTDDVVARAMELVGTRDALREHIDQIANALRPTGGTLIERAKHVVGEGDKLRAEVCEIGNILDPEGEYKTIVACAQQTMARLAVAREERDERREHMDAIADALGFGPVLVTGEKIVARAKDVSDENRHRAQELANLTSRTTAELAEQLSERLNPQ